MQTWRDSAPAVTSPVWIRSFARGRAFRVYIGTRFDGDRALSLSLVAVYGYPTHRGRISSSNSNFPGCFRVWAVNASGGPCVLIPPPPLSLKPCPPPTFASADRMARHHPGLERVSNTIFPTFISPVASPSSQDCSRSARCAPWSGPILHVMFTSSSLHRIQLYIYHIHVPPATPPCHSFLCNSSRHRLALLWHLFITDWCSMCPRSPSSPSSYPYT